jgi:hypothetical protein
MMRKAFGSLLIMIGCLLLISLLLLLIGDSSLNLTNSLPSIIVAAVCFFFGLRLIKKITF